MASLGVATKRTHVVLPDELLSDVDELVGPRGRSSFLTEVIREAVSRKRLLMMLGGSDPILSAGDYPEFQNGSEAWVRAMRSDDQSLDEKRLSGWITDLV